MNGDKKGHLIWCECGKCFIDETKYYARIGGEPTDIDFLDSTVGIEEI